jgi:hypothetical protein
MGVSNDLPSQGLSDHKPIWIRLTMDLNIPEVPMRQPLDRIPRIEIKADDDITIDKFSKKVHKRIMKEIPLSMRRLDNDKLTTATPAESGRIVAASLRITAKVAAEVTNAKKTRKRCKQNSKRGRQKNCFSPDYLTLQAYLSFYSNLVRLAFPSGRRRNRCRWSSTTYQVHLTRLTSQWTKRYLISPVAGLLAPQHLAYLNYHRITLPKLAIQISLIKAKMHGSARLEMRINTNAARRQLEILRMDGKVGMIIKLLTGDPPQDLDLQTLPCPIEGQNR